MRHYLTLLFSLLSLLSFAQNGTITGIISDKDTKGEPLGFANVKIKGTSINISTGVDGKYKLSVPAGNHILVVSFLGYESKETAFSIKEGETKTINVTIGSGAVTMEDVVIKKSTNREKESVLLLEQKKAVEIKQTIGAQEMSRKGISDVEEGLTKITGISKVESRGLFVRGLEDRYNTLLVNDLIVPSNNPFKKILPLDIFSTDIVSVIETYKTFNSNLYGDFAGGTFNIITSKNTKSQTKISFGSGFTTNNNLREFFVSKDQSSTADFFGISGNERALPSLISSNRPSNYVMTTNEASNSFGAGFDVNKDHSALNTSFGILQSDKFSFGNDKNSLNYLLSVNFDNKYQFRKGVDRFFDTQLGIYDNNLITTKYKYSTNTSILAALNYKSKRISLTSNTFFLNATESMIQDQEGYTNANFNQPTTFIRLNELQQTKYLNSQLFGKIKLTQNERHNLKAGISFTRTNFELPDRKSFKGNRLDQDRLSISYGGNSISRQFLDFQGKIHVSGMMEYSWAFGKKEISKAHKFTLGYNGYMNQMESNFRFLVSQPLPQTTDGVYNINTLDNELNSNIRNNKFTYREGSNANYSTKLIEMVKAGYSDIAFKFGDKIDANIGIRVEQTEKLIKYRESGSFDDPFQKTKTNIIDILPAINAKYKISDNSNARIAASKTITRPVIMESYPLEFVNPDATIEQGNRNLQNSENYNVDLKYEIFPSSKQMFTATVFAKQINNPIERLFLFSAGSGGQIISYDNSKKAILYGAEIEGILDLEKINSVLQNFSLGANLTYMDSKVDIYLTKDGKNSPETIARDVSPSRKLQGASSWIVNADLKYEKEFSKTWKSTMTAVYNRYSKRIYAVGTNNLDNYYEMPFDKLDFVWGNKFNEKWDLKFSIDNILNPYYKIEMGDKSRTTINEKDLTIRDFKRGVGFSFNLSYTF
ncbi:MAG: TonB-dependent receptor [Limnohabitans sp.]|nr:TonB-dependent receptor [Limnohabitans sp.]